MTTTNQQPVVKYKLFCLAKQEYGKPDLVLNEKDGHHYLSSRVETSSYGQNNFYNLSSIIKSLHMFIFAANKKRFDPKVVKHFLENNFEIHSMVGENKDSCQEYKFELELPSDYHYNHLT